MLAPILKQTLISQTCCGQTELCAAIENEFDFIEACQNECGNERLQYLHIQLALIEFAQAFARNQIDIQDRNFNHTTKEDFTSTSRKDTNAENTATGRVCSWATATSAQFFNRDSTDDTVAFSEMNSKRNASKDENGYDKSCRHTWGHGFHYTRVRQIVNDKSGEELGAGRGTETSETVRASSTSGGTGPLISLTGITWTDNIVVTPIFPFVGNAGPGPLIRPGGSIGLDICPEPTPENPTCNTEIPSYGQGFHGKYRFTFGIPNVASLTIEWDSSFSERQYYHCSSSTVTADSTIKGVNDRDMTNITTARPEDNNSASYENTQIYHLVRKYGTSTRRGNEQTDAEERQKGYADGISHTESERDSKSQAYQQRRSEALTTGHSESHLRRTDTLSDIETRKRYGQISLQLAQLWKRIWTNIQTIERQIAAIPLGRKMNCTCNRIGCKCKQLGLYGY